MPIPLRRTLAVAACLASILALMPSVLNVRAIEDFNLFFHIDTEVYRQGALAFLRGENLYTRDYSVGGIQLPFTYPPIAAAFFIPLALLPGNIAGVILTVLSAVLLWWCLAIVTRRAVRGIDVADSRLLALVILPFALAAEPVFQTVQFGQINIILMTLVLMDTLTSRPWLPRGFWIGLAASIKLTPAVFGLYFLVKRDWKGAGVCLASGIGFSALAWAIAPASSRIYWTETLRNADRIGNLSYITNQSLQGVLHRLFSDGGLIELGWMLLVVLTLVGVGAAMYRAFKAGNPVAALLLNSLIALLCSPVSWSHHWVWLVPISVVLLSSAWTQRHLAPATATTAGLLGGLVAVAIIDPAFWNMPYHPQGGVGWPLILQPSGNSYVLLALAIVILSLLDPGIFGGAAKQKRGPRPAHIVVLIIAIGYQLANIWFRGDDSLRVHIKYPLMAINSLDLTSLGIALTPPVAGTGALVLYGGLNLLGIVWSAVVIIRYLLGRKLTAFTLCLVILAALITFPVVAALQFGSVAIAVLALVLTDLFVMRHRRARGLFTGVAAGIAGWPVLIAVTFLVQRRWRPAAVAAASTGLHWGAGWLLNPPASALNLHTGWFTGRDGSRNLSPFAFIARWISDSAWAAGIWMVLALALGIWAIHRSHRRGEETLSLALGIALPLLVLPSVEIFHWVLVLPLLVAVLASGRYVVAYLGVFITAISWTPSHLSWDILFPLNHPDLVGSVAQTWLYVLVEPMALAPSAILVALYVGGALPTGASTRGGAISSGREETPLRR
ncbi:glycosyltransferase 87 family protein [Corynebacterium pacaense]|uniref:glycosyltransferase 87 family protein n=1 Tax=Corynebacterium pacaense TaxID=1816684 RepID=UPI0009BAB2B0|nr:glycosyltransferase 87 family protein [Corynebacterium pacaense]